MGQTHLTAAIVLFVALEAINTVVNILPASRQTTAQARKPYFLRAGIVNLVLFAALAAYLVTHG